MSNNIMDGAMRQSAYNLANVGPFARWLFLTKLV